MNGASAMGIRPHFVYHPITRDPQPEKRDANMGTCETCGNIRVLTMDKCTPCWLLGWRDREAHYRKMLQDAIDLIESASKLMHSVESDDSEAWQEEQDWLETTRDWRDEYFPETRKED